MTCSDTSELLKRRSNTCERSSWRILLLKNLHSVHVNPFYTVKRTLTILMTFHQGMRRRKSPVASDLQSPSRLASPFGPSESSSRRLSFGPFGPSARRLSFGPSARRLSFGPSESPKSKPKCNIGRRSTGNSVNAGTEKRPMTPCRGVQQRS